MEPRVCRRALDEQETHVASQAASRDRHDFRAGRCDDDGPYERVDYVSYEEQPFEGMVGIARVEGPQRVTRDVAQRPLFGWSNANVSKRAGRCGNNASNSWVLELSP